MYIYIYIYIYAYGKTYTNHYCLWRYSKGHTRTVSLILGVTHLMTSPGGQIFPRWYNQELNSGDRSQAPPDGTPVAGSLDNWQWNKCQTPGQLVATTRQTLPHVAAIRWPTCVCATRFLFFYLILIHLSASHGWLRPGVLFPFGAGKPKQVADSAISGKNKCFELPCMGIPKNLCPWMVLNMIRHNRVWIRVHLPG